MTSVSQGRLILVGGRAVASRSLGAPNQPYNNIAELTADLIRIPTQGGIDRQEPGLKFMAEWLEQHGLAVRILEAPKRKLQNRPIGLFSEIGSGNGPAYCLTACLDTAPFGAPGNWEGRKPTAARVTADGWLVGRGSADSKAGVAIFSQLMAEMKQREKDLKGRLLLLLDSDEHTGRFGAVKALINEHDYISGVYIGYPGNESIKIGARGFFRAKVSVYGTSSHSGASNPSRENAIDRAAFLVQELETSPLELEDRSSIISSEQLEFGIGPQRTTTAISGGRGYSNVPDYCYLRVDYRLTPGFGVGNARKHLRLAVEKLDYQKPGAKASKIESEQSWPAYKLRHNSPLVKALQDAASQHLGREIKTRVSGPSNVGNFLKEHGVEATCGFGVTERNIHADNEAIKLSSVMPVYNAYRDAILNLLT